jgi:polyferredoxin
MGIGVNSGDALYRPPTFGDILHWPLLGRVLRWRWGRLMFQIPLLIIAILMIYDGLTGPQVAPQNIATVTAWVHYRGLIILALLLVGNLFCMSCPFALPRTLARKLSIQGQRWPRVLRNKWLAIGVLLAFFWMYEWLDLWASPWLTAWLVVAYFVAAFALEAIFAESPFCKYVCPLGTFNFVNASVSPTQVTAREPEVCLTCRGKECVAGGTHTLGCGTELFVPQVKSNMDCVFCLDCARACPHDNVALAVRYPAQELARGAWPRRWDLAFLALVLTFTAVSNAFGMVPPVYTLEETLAGWLNTRSEALVLLLIFGAANLLLPAALGLGAAWLSRQLSGRAKGDSLRAVFTSYTPAVVPLGFAIWLAHYGFHFVTGALTIIPVLQSFILDHGLLLPIMSPLAIMSPNWSLSAILPTSWLLPLQVVIVLAGFAGSLHVVGQVARRAHPELRVARNATLPWLALFLALAFAAVYLFSLPMEMRGASSLLSLHLMQ